MTAQTTINFETGVVAPLYPESRGADISHCGRYRYRLWREWNYTYPTCCFIMLNPSTADANIDDPTIRRCVGFAKKWGYGRLNVVNLFAYRSASPEALYGMSKGMAIGPEGDRHIAEVCNASDIIICAWGNHGSLFMRGEEVIKIIRAQQGAEPMAIKINNKSKQPSHPLYLKADLKPFKL
jgi:hypothetical protein